MTGTSLAGRDSMRCYILRLSAITGVLLASAGTALADVCVTIDQAHDSLSPPEQAAAILLVTREFEQAGERVVTAPCAVAYSLSHAQLGNIVVVNIVGPGGSKDATARGLDDLPAVYSQMVRSIVTGRPMTGLSVVDRTNVTETQALTRRVHSDSLWYARIGYAGLFGDRAYGTPALGFGYRAELDSLAIDVSFLNFQLSSTTDYAASSWGSAASWLKLSGLYFLNPQANRTGYFGGGVSYGRSSFGAGYDYYYRPDRYTTRWEGNGLQS